MFDLVVDNVRLEGGAGPLAVAVRDGRIAGIAPVVPGEGRRIDLGGALLLPGFVETHLHLDKSCILARCAGEGTLASAIGAVAAAKRSFTVEDIYERARRTLEKIIGQGTNLVRSHVEIDPVVGLQGFEAISRLKKDYDWAVEVQICVFPQDGLTNLPGTDRLLRQCLGNGATVLGGCPYTDPRPLDQIDWCFRTAREFDVDLDFHLDFDLDPSAMLLDEVIAQTARHGWGGRVAVGHVTKLSVLAADRLAEVARRLADAGVAVTALPSTDLYLMANGDGPLRPRGVAPVHALAGHAVTSSLATNNFLNPFTPFGDGSLPRIANLYANIAQIGDIAGLACCCDMISHGAAKLLRYGDFGIRVGGPATFIALDAESPAMAIAEIARPRAGFRHGRQTFAHDGPCLMSPIQNR